MVQSAVDWLSIISKEGEGGWKRYYAGMLNVPISNPSRFFSALEKFGQVTMFEAVLAASIRELDGDPLNYILAIAIAKTNEAIQEITDADRYAFNLEKSKQRVQLQNEALEEKMERAKELQNGKVTK